MRRKIFIALLILSVIIFSEAAYPDFGSFSGNTDYGGSSSNSSSRSSSEYSPPRPYRSSGPGRSFSTGSNFGVAGSLGGSALRRSYDNDDDECGGTFIVAVILIMWVLISYSRNKRKQAHEEFNNRNAVPVNIEPAKNLKPIEEYSEYDPEFNAGKIKSLISNLYVQMQDTWHAKDISSLRPYMTDEFYSQMDRQLDAFRKTGRTDYTERIAVLDVSLKGWRQSAGMDYITVGLKSRIVSYVLDDRTGKLLSGDMNREKFMEYEIELCRKSGTITQQETEVSHSATCPHCGAPLKLNASAQCEYCGSVITSVNTEWAICGMKGISQRTV